jgi:CBS domain-containing protein
MIDEHNQAFHTPVCVADLPGYDFAVTPDTLTEKVVAELEKQPRLPGVMLFEDGKLLGILSRVKLFERLSHRFGAGIFLQKPLSQIKDITRSGLQAMPGNFPVEEAIQYAFSRPALDHYDPVVVVSGNGFVQMLDVSLLLQVQARAMASLSNVTGNLEQIDRLIEAGWDRGEVFDELILLLRQVVPYHQAAILIRNEIGLKVIAQVGYPEPLERANQILTSPIYDILTNHGQTINVQNTRFAPAWRGMEMLGRPAAWIGFPVLSGDRLVGILSLSRDVERAFSSKEREIAVGFVQRIAKLLGNETTILEPVFALDLSLKTRRMNVKPLQNLPKDFTVVLSPALTE